MWNIGISIPITKLKVTLLQDLCILLVHFQKIYMHHCNLANHKHWFIGLAPVISCGMALYTSTKDRMWASIFDFCSLGSHFSKLYKICFDLALRVASQMVVNCFILYKEHKCTNISFSKLQPLLLCIPVGMQYSWNHLPTEIFAMVSTFRLVVANTWMNFRNISFYTSTFFIPSLAGQSWWISYTASPLDYRLPVI